MGLNKKILQRFFEGKYSRKDYQSIKSSFEKPEKEAEIKDLLQNHWVNFSDETLPEGNMNDVLDGIQHQIWEKQIPERKSSIIAGFQKIAAILIVPLILTFLTFFYFQSKTTTAEIAFAEIECPMGGRINFVLPDGTTGFLNSGSTLKYPVIFTKERNVALNGEAFFDVMHDEKHPFTVSTSHLTTEVLGTQFNISAYESDQNEEIILKEGKVAVYTEKGEKLETLLPNQKLVLNTKTMQYDKNEVESDQYISWTEGKLVFRNENMQQVANRIGRWYNVEIEIKDPKLLSYAFRATFNDEPLEELLKLLALTAPIKYEVQLREKINGNLYKKKKVIVSLDEKRQDAF